MTKTPTQNGKGKAIFKEIVSKGIKHDDLDETWKPCHMTDKYEVSNMGRVRRTETKFIRKISINVHGYQYITIPIEGKSYTRLVGRMVLHAFIGPPLHKEVSSHIDGNPSNDMLNNLKWTSIGEASCKRKLPCIFECRPVIAISKDEESEHFFISPLEASFFFECTRGSIYDAIRFDRTLYGYKLEYDSSDEPVCEIRKVTGWDSYLVSEDGRIKGKQGGWKFGGKHAIDGTCGKKAYRRSEFVKYVDGKRIRSKPYIHTLVARAFIGECPEGYQVDHIDTDTSHNDVSNLEYVSKSENNKRAYQNGRKPPGEKSVVFIKPNGTFSKYKSQTEGAKSIGVSIATVSKSCSEKKQTMAGEYWARDNPVIRYNGVDDSTERFDSLSIASSETGENIIHILLACRDDSDPSWKYED